MSPTSEAPNLQDSDPEAATPKYDHQDGWGEVSEPHHFAQDASCVFVAVSKVKNLATVL